MFGGGPSAGDAASDRADRAPRRRRRALQPGLDQLEARELLSQGTTPTIRFANAARDAGSVSSEAMQVLTQILQAAGLSSATITRTLTTPEHQAEIMYDAGQTKSGLKYEQQLMPLRARRYSTPMVAALLTPA